MTELLRNTINLVNYINNLCIDSCLTTDKEVVSRVRDLQEEKCIVQVLPPHILTSRIHLLISAYYTFKSFRKELNISKKPYIEFLLYLFGERQVHKVLSVVNREIKKSKYVLITKVCEGGVKPLSLDGCSRVSLDEVIKSFSDIRVIKEVYKVNCKNIHECSFNVLLRTIKLYIDNA